jgi:hypothetical protein
MFAIASKMSSPLEFLDLNSASPIKSVYPSTGGQKVGYSQMCIDVQNRPLRKVPSTEALPSRDCFNYIASADSSFSSGVVFSDFHCLKKVPHSTPVIQISSLFFMTVFSRDSGSLKHGYGSINVAMCASVCVEHLLYHLLYCHHGVVCPQVMAFRYGG